MPRLLTAVLTFVCVVSTLNLCLAENKAVKPKRSSAESTAPSFEDTFERDELGAGWSAVKGDWKIVDGSLVGREKKEDAHAAVVNCNQPNRNSTIQLSFKLDGTDGFHLSFNYAKGHLFRILVGKKKVFIRTDKDKKDPASKPITLATADAEIEPGTWHTMRVKLDGEQVTVQINDDVKLKGSHPSLDVDKPNYRFVVRGATLALDNLKIWVPAE